MASVNLNVRPKIEEIVNYTMVGGTDELYDSPTYFNEACDHPDEEEKIKW